MIITHLTNTKLSDHKPVSILMYNICYNPKIVIYNTYSLPSWTNTLYIITSCFLIYFSVINNITKKKLRRGKSLFHLAINSPSLREVRIGTQIKPSMNATCSVACSAYLLILHRINLSIEGTSQSKLGSHTPITNPDYYSKSWTLVNLIYTNIQLTFLLT